MTPSRPGGTRAMVLRGCRIPFHCCIFVCLFVLLNGCHRGDSAGDTPPTAHKEIWKEFSGAKAFAYTKAQVDFGPRPAGSDALAKTRDYLVESLKKLGWEVELQPFTDNTPNGPIKFVNIIARFPEAADKPAPTTTQRVIVCSHYDTKLFSKRSALWALTTAHRALGRCWAGTRACIGDGSAASRKRSSWYCSTGGGEEAFAGLERDGWNLRQPLLRETIARSRNGTVSFNLAFCGT